MLGLDGYWILFRVSAFMDEGQYTKKAEESLTGINILSNQKWILLIQLAGLGVHVKRQSMDGPVVASNND